MKQGSDTGKAWQDESEPQLRRWLRRLAWLVLPAVMATAAHGLGVALDPVRIALLLIGTFAAGWLWRSVVRRRRRRLWHDEPRIIRSVLQRPARRVPSEQESRRAPHPAVCTALALALAGMLYWVAVLHRMQLPFYWLLALALLLIASLWCWPQPWLLVLIVGSIVGLLSLFSWLASHVSPAGAMAVMLGVLAIVSAGVARFAQHIDRNSKSR